MNYESYNKLKGQLHEISELWFFHESFGLILLRNCINTDFGFWRNKQVIGKFRPTFKCRK